MDIGRFIAEIPDQYYAWNSLCAHPRDALPYVRVLDHVQAMTTPSTMHLLNFACQCLEGDECYLEVGTWRGGTLIGALLNNTALGYAVDNDAAYMGRHNEDEHLSREVWQENVKRFGAGERAVYVEGSTPAIWGNAALTGGNPVGVYFFDGDKATAEAAYDGLGGVVPFLSSRALIIIDDANTAQIRQASYIFRHRHPRSCLLLDLATPANCWPSFWNGLQILGWGVAVEE